MKTVAIISGNFTENGNFSGYNAAGSRIHISGRTMESAGMKKGDKLTFPFYATVVEREFNVLDEQGNPTEEKFKREQAGAVFTNKAALIEAVNADKVLAIEANADLVGKATAVGLSDNAVKALLEVA
jgi:2-hydroxychromene-2-carboxylate isomerase